MTSRAVPSRDAFDLAAVARRKAELGLTTSVVIPARDEGPRVGAVVAAVRGAMAPVAGSGADGGPDVALVDELVVVDGGSRDDTVAQAERAGALVVHQSTDDGPGKGAALRRGVAETSGDLVAFVDADVLAPDEWLAVGTLAPLILNTGLRFVKSAAQRAWQDGDAQDGDARSATGGGRVTELTVRPLLALLWPELAHVAQPLAGEYAADRALLEHLPFERGYGVELGLLLDTARRCGADAIGQVDLGVRAHEHQPLAALGRMATELVLVVADRLAQEGRPLVLDAQALTSLVLPQAERDAGGKLTTVQRTVTRAALPPLASDADISGGPLPARRGPSPSR